MFSCLSTFLTSIVFGVVASGARLAMDVLPIKSEITAVTLRTIEAILSSARSGAEIELTGLHRLLAHLRNDAAFKRERLGFGDGGLINFSRLGGFEGLH